jgi:hypothetical protein
LKVLCLAGCTHLGLWVILGELTWCLFLASWCRSHSPWLSPGTQWMFSQQWLMSYWFPSQEACLSCLQVYQLSNA